MRSPVYFTILTLFVQYTLVVPVQSRAVNIGYHYTRDWVSVYSIIKESTVNQWSFALRWRGFTAYVSSSPLLPVYNDLLDLFRLGNLRNCLLIQSQRKPAKGWDGWEIIHWSVAQQPNELWLGSSNMLKQVTLKVMSKLSMLPPPIKGRRALCFSCKDQDWFLLAGRRHITINALGLIQGVCDAITGNVMLREGQPLQHQTRVLLQTSSSLCMDTGV